MDQATALRLQRLCFHEWLQIPISECPPHYYRLLDLDLFEANPARIDDGARQRLQQLAPHRTGQHAEAAEALARQIQKARATLNDPAKREAYDEALRGRLTSPSQAPAASGNGAPAEDNPAANNHASHVTPPKPRAPQAESPAQSSPAQAETATPDATPAPSAVAPPSSNSRMQYLIVGGLAANALLLVGVLAVLLMRSTPETAPAALLSPPPSQSELANDEALPQGADAESVDSQDAGAESPPEQDALTQRPQTRMPTRTTQRTIPRTSPRKKNRSAGSRTFANRFRTWPAR